jgi:hypothetical protein
VNTRLPLLCVSGAVLAIATACTTLSVPAVPVDRPVSPPQVQPRVMLQIADLPAGFRMMQDGVATLDDLTGSAGKDAKVLLTEYGFASAYSRAFFLENTTYPSSALISDTTMVFETAHGARKMLSLTLKLNKAIGARELTLFKDLGDESHTLVYDEVENGYSFRYVEVIFRNGNTLNTVTGKFISEHEDAVLVFDLARAQLTHQRVDEPAIRKFFPTE